MKQAAGDLEIRLLGQPNVTASGGTVKFARRTTTIMMLALLILRRGQPVTRTFLAFTLFPDLVEARALTELRRYLFHLMKALPPPPDEAEPWLIVDAETVRWNDASGAFVDVVAFDQLGRNAATHEAAIEQYAGDLLEDVYDDWVVAERERYRSSYLTLLAGVIERYRSARDYPRALAFANRLLVADPWREDVVRQLMAIRYASGDSSGALATYDRFAALLRDEMGVKPMPETLAVREAILLDQPLIGSVDRPSGGKRPARAPFVHALPFVARERECALLHARWDSAARGFGNIVFLGGEAGIGKTRLTGELARFVESQGGRVFSGGTSSPESSPYQSVSEALRSALSVLTANAANNLTINVLSRVFPELQEASGAMPDIGALPADREAARLYSAFGSAVIALASPRPVLLVLEDLHWASTSTIDAIATVCRRIDRARVLIVGTYRDDEISTEHPLHRLLNALGIEQRMTDVHLSRFDRSETEAMIRAHTALASAEPELIDRLHSFSEGNALFLNEAIADAVESDDAAASQSGHDAIDGIVASRIGRLSDVAQTIVEIAAVCGQGCSIDVVRDVAGFSMFEALTGFDELLDRRLVREAGARDRYDFVFTHNLIRMSIYDRMEARVRVRRHARVAHVIAKSGSTAPGDVRELARHCEAANLHEDASRWYALAAGEAASQFANDEAVLFATRALELTSDAARSIELMLIREEANARLGNRAAQSLDLAALQAADLDAGLQAQVLRRVVLLLRADDDREAERRALTALAAHAARSDDRRLLGLALSSDAQFRLSIGDYGAAKDLVFKALPHLEAAGAASDRLEALSTVLEAQVSLGEVDAAETLLATLQDLAIAVGDRAALCNALMRTVSAATQKQEFQRAADAANEALIHYRVIGDRVGEARALSSSAMAWLRLSRWDEARRANVAAAAICETIGDRRGLARAQMNLGMLHGRCGDLATARKHFLEAREHHRVLGDRRALTAALLNESFIAIWQNVPAEAKALATQAEAEAREMDHAAFHAAALANLGAAERDLGEVDTAISHMEEGLAMQLALNRMADAVSDMADAALAYARRGDLATARSFAERIMVIDASWTDTAIFPPYPLWVVACVLHWCGDERDSVAYAWAWQLAQALAETIRDDDLRTHFQQMSFYVAMQGVSGRTGWPLPPGIERSANASLVASDGDVVS